MYLSALDLNIFYFISHEKGLGRAQMLQPSPGAVIHFDIVFTLCAQSG